MELRVFTTAIEPIGTIDELESLVWKTKYFDVGTALLLAPITENNNKLLVRGNVLVKHDGKNEVVDKDGTLWRRAIQITYIRITKDEKGQEQIEAQGFALSHWLSKRVIAPQVAMNATIQNINNRIVIQNMGSGASNKRKFQQFEMLEQSDMGGGLIEYTNELYADVGAEIKRLSVAGKLGYDILINERKKKYAFYLYKGNDLTATNSGNNTPCIFSRDFDNVNEQEYEASIENIRNFIYVMGAADEEGNTPMITVDNEQATGIELNEIFHNASDIARKYKPEGSETEVIIPYNTYLSLLQTRGDTELGEHGENVNFVSTINILSNLEYKKDFDVGDRITCLEKKWNIKIDARITEIAETYQKGKEEIDATFGESLPTLIEKIKKVR